MIPKVLITIMMMLSLIVFKAYAEDIPMIDLTKIDVPLFDISGVTVRENDISKLGYKLRHSEGITDYYTIIMDPVKPTDRYGYGWVIRVECPSPDPYPYPHTTSRLCTVWKMKMRMF